MYLFVKITYDKLSRILYPASTAFLDMLAKESCWLSLYSRGKELSTLNWLVHFMAESMTMPKYCTCSFTCTIFWLLCPFIAWDDFNFDMSLHVLTIFPDWGLIKWLLLINNYGTVSYTALNACYFYDLSPRNSYANQSDSFSASCHR